jgi:hypothetical protein
LAVACEWACRQFFAVRLAMLCEWGTGHNTAATTRGSDVMNIQIVKLSNLQNGEMEILRNGDFEKQMELLTILSKKHYFLYKYAFIHYPNILPAFF